MENRFAAGVIILSVFEGAYISEIIRGSLLSLEESQLEAARAVGFTKRQTLRYVILPQLVTRTLPALTGQCASIIKDSSLLSMIAVIELTQTIREITAVNFRMFECYLFLGLLYLCLTLPISFVSKRLLPTAGRVSVGGEELPADEKALQKYRKGLGFVFQQGGLFRHLSAMENITLPLEQVHDYTRQEAVRRAEELLERFGLGADGRKKPGALSGGQ